MQFEHVDIDRITVVMVKETQLTSKEAPDVKTSLLEILSKGQNIILINLQTVEHIDSTGLGALLFGKRQSAANDKEIYFCELNKKVTSLIRIARLDQVFTLFENEEEALKALQ